MKKWLSSNKNDINNSLKRLYFKKNCSRFPSSKWRTMEFMRYVALRTLETLFFYRMCRNKANNRTFTLFSEVTSIFHNDVFSIYLSGFT